jgi:predicted nucleotidyltransferase
MYCLDKSAVQKALDDKGFRSIQAFARHLGIHRNTVHHYLSGGEVLPTALGRILDALSLEPANAFQKKVGSSTTLSREIASLADRFHVRFPETTLILFGSRARGTSHPYSDYDLGVYASGGISHPRFLEMVREVKDLEESVPFMVDLVNLNRADDDFLNQASRNWLFLAGRQQDWIELQEKAHER